MTQVNPNYSMLETDSSIAGTEMIPTQDATTLIDGKVTIDAIRNYALGGTSGGRIDLSGITPTYASQEDAFIGIGTYTVAKTIADTGATFVPIQVNLKSTGNAGTAGNQVAAARLRVDNATNAQGNTAIAVLQLRSDIAKNCYAYCGLSESCNVSANITISPGEFQVGFWQLTGAGNITCSTGNVSVIEARMAGTGTGVDYVGLFGVNTAAAVDSVIMAQNLAGTVTNGVQVSGTFTNALKIAATSLNATSGRSALIGGDVAAPAHTDGYGTVEINANFSGTVAGPYACASSTWINFAAASVPGGNIVAVRNDGIYLPSGITASSATMIMGGRFHYMADDGANPGSLYLFSTNIYSNALTAIFHVNAAVDFTFTSGAASTNAGKIPLFHDVTANKTWYVNVYDG